MARPMQIRRTLPEAIEFIATRQSDVEIEAWVAMVASTEKILLLVALCCVNRGPNKVFFITVSQKPVGMSTSQKKSIISCELQCTGLARKLACKDKQRAEA